MKIRARYDNTFLGHGVFWEGEDSEIEQLQQVVVKALAREAVEDGEVHHSGMWTVGPAAQVLDWEQEMGCRD